MIKTKNLIKKYHTKKNTEVTAVDNIELDLADTGLTVVLGKSGCGKTTLINILSGLDSCDSGEVTIEEKNILNFTQKEWDIFRKNNIGIVFQDFNLLDDINVYDNIALPLKILGVRSDIILQKVQEVLSFVNLEGYGNRNIDELSAGQKQRVAIARALAKNPKIIFMDEPTGNLDEKNTIDVFKLLEQISKQCLVIVVSHDIQNTKKFADRIIQIKDGKVISDEINYFKKHNSIIKVNIINKQDNLHKIYEDIEEIDFCELIHLFIDKNENYPSKEIDLNIKVEFERNNPENKINKTTEEIVTNNKKEFSAKDILKFSICNLKNRKIRLLITSFLFIFTTIYTLLLSVLITYDYKDTLVEYLKNENISIISLNRETTYHNILNEKILVSNDNGENFIKDINSFVKQEDIIKTKYFDNIYTINNSTDEKIQYFDVTSVILNNFTNIDLIGEAPQSSNEIVVTDYIASILFPNITDINSIINTAHHCYYKSLEFKIVGIIKTDYLDKNTHTMDITEYSYTLIHEDFQNKLSKSLQIIEPKSCNFTKSFAFGEYVESSNFCFAPLDATAENGLIWGRKPEKYNEVMVSHFVAQNIGYDTEDKNKLFPTKFMLPNLKDDKYNDAYDCINLYDYFPNGVEIVGVFDAYADESLYDTDVVVENNIYNDLKKEYYNYYFFDNYYFDISNYKYDQLINNLDQYNFKVNDYGSQYIYQFVDTVKELKNIIYIMFFVSVSITIFFLISYISYSIKDQSRKIGIMRSLGISKNNIVKIFITEVLCISIISISLAILVYLYINTLINEAYIKYMKEYTFNIININPILVSLVFFIILLISLLLAYIPIRSMSKKNPIDMLKNNR